MRLAPKVSGLAAAVSGYALAGAALAQDAALEIIGQPKQGGTGFQPASTELARDQQWLDGALHWLSAGVVALVLGLLLIVILRFNRRANPTPARFTHNAPLEVAWTLVPVVILVVLGAFSLPILFKQQEIPEADVTIKVTGNAWFWNYEYPDEGISFDSFLIGHPATLDDKLDPGAIPFVYNDAMKKRLERSGYTGDQFLLATDTSVVVPVGKTVVVQVTSADVIHSWKVPAFAVMQDAVPGRIAELWFKPEREGIFFGQCSELCGKDHAYMPVTVKVVSQQVYDAWVAQTKTAGAYVEPDLTKVASN